MKRRYLGNSDLQVSEVCLGTMTFGQQNDEAQAHAQLDRALAAGINFIDTAEMYPVPPRATSCGRTEEIIGSWLRRQPRDRLIEDLAALALPLSSAVGGDRPDPPVPRQPGSVNTVACRNRPPAASAARGTGVD
jgi:hypothetical protein